MADKQAVVEALAGLAEGYKADGYELSVDEVSGSRARLRISALENACEECLVPKPIAIGTIKVTLKGLPEITQIDLVYPTDGGLSAAH